MPTLHHCRQVHSSIAMRSLLHPRYVRVSAAASPAYMPPRRSSGAARVPAQFRDDVRQHQAQQVLAERVKANLTSALVLGRGLESGDVTILWVPDWPGQSVFFFANKKRAPQSSCAYPPPHGHQNRSIAAAAPLGCCCCLEVRRGGRPRSSCRCGERSRSSRLAVMPEPFCRTRPGEDW